MATSFARYAAIVKNLRGVVLADFSEERVSEEVDWLTKRFKYRDLGVVPWVLENFGDRLRGRLGGNPFRELYAPVEAVAEAVDAFQGALGVSRAVAELLVFASTYISPGILAGERFLGELRGLAEDSVFACRKMDLNSWKLHLRIADYTVLDFYERSVEEAIASHRGEADVEAVLGERKSRISRDKKRYWRIACDEGELFLLYVDNLALAHRKSLLKSLKAEACPALSIVPVVYLNPALLP